VAKGSRNIERFSLPSSLPPKCIHDESSGISYGLNSSLNIDVNHHIGMQEHLFF